MALPITQKSRWDDTGQEPPAGSAKYTAGEQPIAEYDNWFNYNVSDDLQKIIDAVNNELVRKSGDALTGSLKIEMETPSGVTASPSAVAGSLAAGTYYYVVTALDGIGETIASAEVSATIDGATNTAVDISWNAVPGAVYRVYGRASGAQDQYWETTNTSFTDDGTAGTAGTPPTATTAYVVNINENGDSWFLGGKVGIGTTSPVSALHVNGIVNNAGTRTLITGYDGNDNHWYRYSVTDDSDLIYGVHRYGVNSYEFRYNATLRPQSDDTFSLGLSSQRWADVYVVRARANMVYLYFDDGTLASIIDSGANNTGKTWITVRDGTGFSIITRNAADTADLERFKVNNFGDVVDIDILNANLDLNLNDIKNVYRLIGNSNRVVLSTTEYRLFLEPGIGLGTADNGYVDFFRNTALTGTKQIRVFKGDNTATITLSIDADTGNIDSGAIKPKIDNTYDLGSSSLRWANLYAANASVGDLIYEERSCPLCGEEFKEGDQLGSMVNKITGKGTHTIPVHLGCQLSQLKEVAAG